MKHILIICFCFGIIQVLFGQNIGINNTDPIAALDIKGDIRLRPEVLNLTPVNYSLDVNTLKASIYIMPTTTAVTNIYGFTASSDGRVIIIINTSSYDLNVLTSGPSVDLVPVANRIIGSAGTLLPNSSMTFSYSAIKSRWIVIGKSGDSGNEIWQKNEALKDVFTKTTTYDVGIGTQTPQTKLEINSGIENVSGLRLSQMSSDLQARSAVVSTFKSNIPGCIGLAIDDNGYLFASGSNNIIYKISPDGTTLDTFSSSSALANPKDIIFGPDKKLYVANFNNNNVIRISTSGIVDTFSTGFNKPFGLAFDPSGNLYVTNYLGNTLSKILPSGIVVSHSYGTGLTNPTFCSFVGAMFSPGGTPKNVLISNTGGNNIYRINIDNSGPATFYSNTGGSSSSGLIMMPGEELYFGLPNNGKLIRRTKQNSILYDFTFAASPHDIIADKAGTFYVASATGNTILKIGPSYKNVLAVNSQGDVVPANLFNNGYLESNTDPSLKTNAVFGSNGYGVSLLKDDPTIAFNAYKDNSNALRLMGAGAGFTTKVDPIGGSYTWNKLSSGPLNGLTTETNLMTLTQDGKLGIGISNPSYPLSINTNGTLGLFHQLDNRIFMSSIFGDSYVIGTSTNDRFNLIVNNSTALSITTDKNISIPGNVRIGSSTPSSYKLAVNGTIRAKEVVVESAWADYVFNEKYQLRSLADLEAYINKNKHLPNIPPAKEIETEGLELGTIQTKMMEKIEELTLYLIQLNKEVIVLDKEIKVLSKTIKK